MSGDMVRRFPQKLIRLSVARAKVRFGYAPVFEICLSGFLAGVIVFWISVALYFLSAALSWLSADEAFFVALAGELATFLRIQVFARGSLPAAMANLAAISAIIGAAGIMAAMIRRYCIRRESSHSFFRRKVRVPFDVLPFFAFFGYPYLQSRDLFWVYVLLSLMMAFLWRWWCGVVLSFVSSFDVDRLMPKPL